MDTHDIILAARNKAMNTYSQEDAREILRASVDRAYQLAETPLPNGPDYEELVENVTAKVLRSYPYLTSQEVALVAEAGVAGEFGARTKPSAAAFFGWLAAYVASDIRKEAIRNYRRSNVNDPASQQRTEAEVAEMNRVAGINGLRTLWNEYKTQGRLSESHLRGYVAMVMDTAVSMDLFDISAEHWKMAREEARERERRRIGMTLMDGALPYEPVFLVKWCMLEMCFEGQKATGRDLAVNF